MDIRFAEGPQQVVLFKILCFKWSVKKYCLGIILQGIWEIILYGNDRNYKFSYKFTFTPFLYFHRIQKQESEFQLVGGPLSRNSFDFCS